MSRRTRGRGMHHEQRRLEIADAVLAVVAKRGLPAVSLAEVAAEAGISAGRVQYYFPTKRDLVAAAFVRGNAQNAERIRQRVGQDLETAPPRVVLTAVLAELIPVDPATRAQMRVRQWFNSQALSDEDIAERLRPEYATFHEQMTTLIRREQDAERIPTGTDAHDTAVSLVALVEGLAYYVLMDVYRAEDALSRLAAAIEEIWSR